jgi:hypothetical protein
MADTARRGAAAAVSGELSDADLEKAGAARATAVAVITTSTLSADERWRCRVTGNTANGQQRQAVILCATGRAYTALSFFCTMTMPPRRWHCRPRDLTIARAASIYERAG